MRAAGAAVVLVSGMALANVTSSPAPMPGQTAALAAAAIARDAAASEAAARAAAQARLDPRAVTCIAKVVHHEASNQPKKGQIAVAHVLVNRVKKGFGDHVCEVANQRGQFFRLSRYKPSRKTEQWAKAVAVARIVLAGQVDDPSRGALFYRATWKPANAFFRTRTRVTRLDDHVFYR